MSELNEVLVSMEQVKDDIKNAELLEQLHRSPAFKKLIVEGYFKTEAINLVGAMAHPMSETNKEQLRNKMVGISALHSYFNMLFNKGNTAMAALKDHEAAVEEISKEL